MSDYRFNQVAPRRLITKGIGNYTPAIGRLFKDLGFAFVPIRASHDSAAPVGRDLIGPVSANFNANHGGLVGEACGPAIKFPTWADFPIPRALATNSPFSCFCFYVPRSTTDGMVLINYGGGSGAGATGWGMLHNGTANSITMISWGIAGWGSTVPTGPIRTPQCAGLSYNGSDVRFFVQGRFSTQAAITTPRSFTGGVVLGSRADHINNVLTGSVHVAYIWNRAITDSEFMMLYRDPWVIARPREPRLQIGAGAPAAVTRAFVPGFIG